MDKRERVTGKPMSFSIRGEFITETAREKLMDGKFEKAMDLVMGCIRTDELSEREREHLAFDIVNGSADLVGTYPGEDYGVEDYGEEKRGALVDGALTSWKERAEAAEAKFNGLAEKFSFLMERLQMEAPFTLRAVSGEYESEYGEPLAETLEVPLAARPLAAMDPLLSKFLEKAKRDMDEKERIPEYGWLEPNGTYHPVEWGEHGEWAQDWVKTHYPRGRYPEMYHHEIRGIPSVIDGGDVLTYKLGWICIDSPSGGMGSPRMVAKPMTEKQKDFLYGYYMERGRKAEANALYENDGELEQDMVKWR